MGNKLKKKNHDEIKNDIIKSAKQIIKDEGVEALSIRKITKLIGYSPGIVYHYFKDKDEIIHCIYVEGYKTL